MVKRIGILLLVAALILLPGLSLAGTIVVDNAGLFTEDQITRIEAAIEQIQTKWQIDGVIMTDRLPKMTDEELQDYADVYFEEHGYGLGEDAAGFLVLIDMGNRYMHISTSGVMIDYMDDGRIEKLLDTLYDYATSGRYGEGVSALLSQMQGYLQKGIQEGHFRFDAKTGQRLTGLYNMLTTGEIVFASVLGLGAGLVVFLSVLGAYRLKFGTYKYDFRQNSSMSLTEDEKTFLRQSTHRTRVPRDTDGSSRGGGGGSSRGSSVHISSGGGTHGGGGRHF